MKFFLLWWSSVFLCLCSGCANNQRGNEEESIRASVRRQDSIGAQDRLDRLRRQVREEQKIDTLRDTTNLLEE